MSQRHFLSALICLGCIALLLSVRDRQLTSAANSLNGSPVAVNDSYTVHGHLFINLVANDYNPEGDGLFFNAVETQPQHGTLVYYSSGSYTYHAAYAYVGSDSFTYSIKDSANNIATATVNITIVNQAPIAVPDFYIKSGSLLITPAQNDFDPDPDPRNFQSIVTHHDARGN